ncbi:putative amino acid transporter, transmembrane domain-containing protein [Helianthus debilis subsp. tardiflorus]
MKNCWTSIGIITVPYAVAAGGWLSLLLLLTIAISTFFTGLLIKRCMDIDPTIRSYADIGERAFGKSGRIIVLVTTNLELYLVATAFLILEGDNLSNLFPQVHFDIYGLRVSSKKSFVIMVAAIILPTTWFKNMRILSYISVVGVLASFVILGSILWVVNWNGMPSALCLYAFCYGAHPVFPTLYTSMKNKHQFSKVLANIFVQLSHPLKVLLLCFVLCTITYSSMAIVGYRMFGSKAESQITLNLPTNKASSQAAIFTTLISPIVKYALLVVLKKH